MISLTFVTHEHGGKQGIVGEVEKGKNKLRGVGDDNVGDQAMRHSHYCCSWVNGTCGSILVGFVSEALYNR